MKMLSNATLIVWCCGFVFLCGAGCSNESDLPKAVVTGEVYLNGEPFTGAAVRFYNPKLGGGAFNLDEAGAFESGEPIVVGEYTVSLDRPGPNVGENPGEMTWPEDQTKDLPQKYLKGSKSGLTAQVSEMGENHFLFNIEGAPKSSRGDGREGPQVIEPITTTGG
ncbi:MAG: hypothetical protein HUJ26_11110 [Planctomycetaceae bacterium]|nr:hypothetical protein [Planctomycetaceae bacterium]